MARQKKAMQDPTDSEATTSRRTKSTGRVGPRAPSWDARWSAKMGWIMLIASVVLGGIATWVIDRLKEPNPFAEMAGTYTMPSFALEEAARFYARNRKDEPFPKEMLSSIRLTLFENGRGTFNIGGVEAAVTCSVSDKILSLELAQPRDVANDLRRRNMHAGNGDGLAMTEELRLGPDHKRISFPVKTAEVAQSGKVTGIRKEWFNWAYLERQ